MATINIISAAAVVLLFSRSSSSFLFPSSVSGVLAIMPRYMRNRRRCCNLRLSGIRLLCVHDGPNTIMTTIASSRSSQRARSAAHSCDSDSDSDSDSIGCLTTHVHRRCAFLFYREICRARGKSQKHENE
jgi:hypothetical protein